MNGNERVAEFIHNTRWDDFPDEVKQKAKMCLLDTLGAILVGTSAEVSEITSEYAKLNWEGDEATILLRGIRANVVGAAFANGFAANAYDCDDGALYTKGHPGAQLIPTALAVSERMDLSGKELLTALVVGYEVAMRTARCWHDHHDIYQACGSWGSVACAATSAHLMKLNARQIQHALGIAEYYSPNLPMMRDIMNPAMVKHGIGWGAMTGIMATQLAKDGFTGIPSILGYSKYEHWISDIGEEYLITKGVTFKEFASCSWSHPPIIAARALLQTESIPLDEIERMQITGFQETVALGAQLPKSTEEAQFNSGWPLAVFLLYGEVSPNQMKEESLSDARAIELVQKVEFVESDQFSEWARLKWLGHENGKYTARLRIFFKNGQSLDSGVISIGSDYGADWDEANVSDKFRWMVRDVLDNERTDELINFVRSFDQLDQMASFIDLIS
jgi:2-methylcitrate dehydratase PrpD